MTGILSNEYHALDSLLHDPGYIVFELANFGFQVIGRLDQPPDIVESIREGCNRFVLLFLHFNGLH